MSLKKQPTLRSFTLPTRFHLSNVKRSWISQRSGAATAFATLSSPALGDFHQTGKPIGKYFGNNKKQVQQGVILLPTQTMYYNKGNP